MGMCVQKHHDPHLGEEDARGQEVGLLLRWLGKTCRIKAFLQI